MDAAARAQAANFEEWCLDLMGPVLYERYIKPYTEKQWGRPARELSAQWAPRRVSVRWDDDPYLFPDPHQGWPAGPNGYTDLIDGLLDHELIELRTGVDVTLDDLDAHARRDADAIVLTCPLDVFCGERFGSLDWRGILVRSVHVPHVDHAQGAMVVNYPGPEFPFIRIHETKHASRQECEGTVLGLRVHRRAHALLPDRAAGEPGAERPLPGLPARRRSATELLLRGPPGQLPLHRHGRLHAPGARHRRGRGAPRADERPGVSRRGGRGRAVPGRPGGARRSGRAARPAAAAGRRHLLVVDNTPGRAARAERSHAPEIHTPGYARNRGAAEGSAEWLVFIDADVTPAPDLLDRYFEPAAGGGARRCWPGGIADEPVPPGGPGRRAVRATSAGS